MHACAHTHTVTHTKESVPPTIECATTSHTPATKQLQPQGQSRYASQTTPYSWLPINPLSPTW